MKHIELTANKVGRLVEKQAFLLTENSELTLEFKHLGYNLSNAIIELKNGENTGNYAFTNFFNVPKKFLIVGKLNITVKMFVGETLTKTWFVYPILIKEIEQEFYAFDELTALEKEIENLKKRIILLENKHKHLM